MEITKDQLESLSSSTESNDPRAHPTGNAIKDPETWVTKDEPMTGAQASYLKTLSEEAGVDFQSDLTKAGASEKIDELQKRTGRGQASH